MTGAAQDGTVSVDPVALEVDTPARQRLAADLLGWGAERPLAPPDLARQLRADLEAGVQELREGLVAVAATRPRRRVTVAKTGLRRVVCDGWQLDPEPYVHTRASVRGTMAQEAIAADWSGHRHAATGHLVDRVWDEMASRRPGDPASLSAWLNLLPGVEAEALRVEVADLVDAFREVWPPLPAAVIARVRRPLEVRLAGGLVSLQGAPDLVLDSPRDDAHARSLLVDLKTGLPRPEADRHDLRFHGLLVTLSGRRPPFRWGTFYVTEGRTESEDLGERALEAAAVRVLDLLRQTVRIAAVAGRGDAELRLQAGGWCRSCLRVETCAVAAAAR